MKELDLRRNRITDSGAKALAVSLKSHGCSLEELRLGGNQISDIGINALALSTKLNTTIKSIEIDETDDISEIAKQNLVSALKRPRPLSPEDMKKQK